MHRSRHHGADQPIGDVAKQFCWQLHSIKLVMPQVAMIKTLRRCF